MNVNEHTYLIRLSAVAVSLMEVQLLRQTCFSPVFAQSMDKSNTFTQGLTNAFTSLASVPIENHKSNFFQQCFQRYYSYLIMIL